MSKNKEKPASQEVLPAEETSLALLDSRARSLVGIMPLDSADEINQLIAARLRTDPGVPAGLRDKWAGTVVRWLAFADEQEDEETGEVSTIPILSLMSREGDLVRLSGWPAISSWAAIIKALGPDRCLRGVPVVVHRRMSGTVGRSYWVVTINVSLPQVGDGELPM